ncbi:ABC transporter ATP-binding protein, partial [Streptomyces sp. SID8380]|nr:ABC transporter ATP-binding protein [Streptomyces sp. SID8380]
PDVLVLDEPTSAVDAHTESRIAGGLAALRAGRTTVVLTSSPLLLDAADRVVLVLGDTVVAEGAHRELLAAEPRYRAVVTRETDEERADPGTPREVEAGIEVEVVESRSAVDGPAGGAVVTAPADELPGKDTVRIEETA